MVAASFEYVRAAGFEEAAEVLAAYGEDAKLLAGGQSLVPMMNLRLVRPSALVDLSRLPVAPPVLEGSVLRLDALTRHQSLLTDPVVSSACPLLPEAVSHVGNVRVRARGTIGGSLAHADPTAELGACALVLGAELTATSPRGRRNLAVRDLFVSYLTTSLEPDEVITEVRLKAMGPRQGWGFREMVRRSSDLAIVAVAARVEVDESMHATSLEVSLAGVADRVLLVEPEVLSGLLGTGGDAVSVAQVAAAVAAGVEPESDVHASAEYRRRLVAVLSRRAVTDAFRRAASGRAA